MQKGEADSYYPLLIASKTAVDVSTLATVQLDWIEGATLETHWPVFAFVKYNAGAMGIAVVVITAATFAISNTKAITSLDATNNKLVIALGDVVGTFSSDPTKFMGLKTTTASLDPTATVDVYVYGIELN